ncbi:sensor histidine kinase [Cohnella herbarum]|uniref:histidine kinase n=1 Tax=Cohnella herbarum TaxID=2728023 RepID=A0A7Z2VPD3_9BACL|nr:histidine kinase [Cohnella herbarum]QJD86702.1 hypothetical protein HH215_28365 [Cohnella herbarum]
MIRFLTTHIPLFRILLGLTALILCIGLALTAFQQRDSNAIQLNPDRWSWAPARSFEDAHPPSEGWQDHVPGTVIPAKAYWIRVPIPRNGWADPQLFVLRVGSIKAYADGAILYDYILKTKQVHTGFHWKMIAVPLPAPDHVDLLVKYAKHSPLAASVVIGNKSSLLNIILINDLDNLILGTLLLFSGIIALGLYATQRDRLYLFFALLAFSGGFAALVRNLLLQVIWDIPQLAYFHDSCLSLATFAFIGVLRHVFPTINRRKISFLLWVMLADTVLTIIAALANPRWYYSFTINSFGPLFAVVFIAVSWTLWTAYRSRKDLESIWLLAGFTSLTVISLIHMYRFILIFHLPEWFNERMLWVHRLPADSLFWGLFLFVVCLIRVIMHRYTGMNRQLTEFNRSLENVVQTRTQQLQERTEQLETAHEQLGASMRENAEALAEAMILEERHRITGSIHDTVGHTLSATIIQLEAAKRLIAKDHDLAEEKLEASQDLVRRGLEDIRQSVRLLRDDASYYDLLGSIGALIREKEHLTGCQVDSQFDLLPLALSTFQKRIVFQTLQEGLSLGIKHGSRKPFHFQFIIRSDMKTLNMQLIHLEEHDYSAKDLGFSLQAIAEQAALIGGVITADDEKTGYVITLLLPLTPAS